MDRNWKFVDEKQAERITVPGFRYVIIKEQDKGYLRLNIVNKMFLNEDRRLQK